VSPRRDAVKRPGGLLALTTALKNPMKGCRAHPYRVIVVCAGLKVGVAIDKPRQHPCLERSTTWPGGMVT